ncbi:MAG: T9SS type A sorting domain-containing protein [Bacteroidetes bacterium]|nr:T9SS type A sorting domain-containing protein [Bacteroidota bacterium]
MKNQLLLVSAIGIASLAVAQSAYNPDKYTLKLNQHPEIIFSEVQSGPIVKNNKKKTNPVDQTKAVSIIDLGQAGNAFGTGFGGKTFLWADPNLNAITFSHRSEPVLTGDLSHGFLRYDYSVDGGTNWFVDQGAAYISNNTTTPPFANARYPQGVYFSPAGNTNADSGYFAYFAPTLASTNGSSASGGWGGHCHGSMQVSGNMFNRQKEETSSRFLIPDGFTLTKTGVTYNTDAASNQAASPVVSYTDTIIISKGIWNTTTRDFDYTVSYLRAPVSKDNKNTPDYAGEHRIAFADDGQTGYITLIGHSSYVSEPDSIYHLIVYKTTDGGTTWSSPINVSMDGVKPLLPNAVPFKPNKFTTGFEMDAVVDKNDNLHVVMPVSPEMNTGYSISTKAGTWGIFDIYTTDGGTSWKGKLLGMPQTLVGTFGVSAADATNPTIAEYNRCQASRTLAGDKLFFSWFDTDTINYAPLDQNHANMHPNAFVIGYDVTTNKWTNEVSTASTIAADVITFGCASYYVFGNTGTYTFPLVYVELTGDETKTGLPVLFHYLNGFTLKDADFTVTDNSVPLNLLISVNDIKENHGMSVSQNYPNPFNSNTSFKLTLDKNASVTVEVFNTIGQKVTGIDAKTYSAGEHTITINGNDLTPGVYFYTVRANDASVTQRMMVK